ncbi:MAG: hypothetical protein M1828_004690 [Chrysothrix sp. TS-e1954]|nr:MAG: hypothetical protein M1828_004690 [Chrysothrix sp. TS-e1954]
MNHEDEHDEDLHRMNLQVIRQNADPLLSLFKPLRAGKLASATTSSSVLLHAIPHLYKLAQYPVVIHVSLDNGDQQSEYSDITSIRQCGFSFIHSETLQEAQDLALTAHALAIKSGKGVIHFFDPTKFSDDKSIGREQQSVVSLLLDANAAYRHQQPTGTDAPIYADTGRYATIKGDEMLQSPARPHSGGNGHALPLVNLQTTSASIPDASSSESSRRESDSEPPSDITSISSTPSLPSRPVSSDDIYQMVQNIWSQLYQEVGRQYKAFEYTGPKDATSALFAFGADAGHLGEEMGAASSVDTYAGAGLITVRLYRPWIGSVLSQYLPHSIRKIAVLEQIRRRTTKWGPILLDILTSMNPGNGRNGGLAIIGYQLGYLERSTMRQALNGVFSNLLADRPVQNLEVGLRPEVRASASNELSEQPQLENAYMKILQHLFGSRLALADRIGANNAGVSSRTTSTPEFGLGSLMARKEHQRRFVKEVEQAAKSRDFTTDVPREWMSRWALDVHENQWSDTVAKEAIARLVTDGSSLSRSLLKSQGLFYKESSWLIGSDAWAYDLGNSGVHSLLASGENINMLIIDSQPYSEAAAADSQRRKKDIGLYAMNFGNAYVASTAVYSSYTQVLEAMLEADKFDGPSVVLAYLPYNKESESPVTVLQETKKAVDLGYWPLYRWHPATDDQSEPNFQLDSERIKRELEDFLKRDNQLTQLMKRQPEFAANLPGSYGSEVRDLQKRKAKDAYEKLLEGLYGAPLTVLFASDNGNAESLAKRLASRGRARGLKSTVFAMDEYPLEDLPSEENVVMITSTAGQGEFPQNGRSFWETVKNSTDLDLATVNFSVFALGDSHYWPRKEDRIYYNKPGKDLNNRILALGGKPMTDTGLGDDQDPDAYQTGYSEWEPKLWQALGVANVEGLPEEPPPITNEDIKADSNYLRGTIAEGLEDTSTGAIAASDQQLTKFHGTYMQDDRDLRDERKAQGLEPAYAFMIRCRLNGGVATPSQWEQMDDIATNLGNKTMKLTTRQTFQFHGVVKGKLRPAMQGINKALMTTLAACGDVNRNVMCSALPQKSQFHAEVHSISKRISDHLLPSTSAYHEIWLQDANDKKTQVAGDAIVDQEPLYGPVYLPRKFKITIAIPPHNDTDVYAHDIGLIAIADAHGHLQGFNVLAGGGMGVTHNNKKTYPRTGSHLGYCPVDQTHIVCEKVMLVQKDHGDRTNRKHARLKYTMDDMGVDVFKGKVEELWGRSFEASKPFHFDSNIDTFGWQTDETGKHHFTMFIENGRIEDTADFPMKTGLREIAKVHKGEFRLTGNQHLVLSDVPEEDLASMKEMLAKYKLDNTSFSGLRLSSSACVAFPTCGLAMAESERYLPLLITKLEGVIEESGLRHDSIVMRVTGCPNGCARPWLAEIGLVGKSYGAYNMYLGGGYHGQRLNKLYRSSIMEEEILEILKPAIKQYALERKDGERFGDFVIRKGMIKPTTEGKTFHDDVAELEEDDE